MVMDINRFQKTHYARIELNFKYNFIIIFVANHRNIYKNILINFNQNTFGKIRVWRLNFIVGKIVHL